MEATWLLRPCNRPDFSNALLAHHDEGFGIFHRGCSMTKSSLVQERQTRFGLAEVSGAVSDYYDLLFDNVKEFIGINR
jgi:hypothetical protein